MSGIMVNSIRFPSYTRRFLLKKKHVLKNCKKYFKIDYVEYHIHEYKDDLCFYKRSTNQTFIFISTKVVYKHHAHQV